MKTAQHFADYHYTIADGAAVRFKLVSTNKEQNNAKGDRRFFVPRLGDIRFEEESRKLNVPFEYRHLNQQEAKSYGK